MSQQVEGLFFIVQKHITVKNSKKKNYKKRRKFHDELSLPAVRELAQKYAKENGVDFLIVKVIEEVSKPEGAANENIETDSP